MLPRLLQCLGLAVLLVASASAQPEDPWIRGIYAGESPRPVRLSEAEAWQRAAEIADHTPGAFVLAGSGHSMQPLYRPGTILVLRKLAFNQLKRGQTALYRNKENKVVAHVLVAKTRDGWRAHGLNNRVHDMEPVSNDNLVGVVVAAYMPVGRSRAVTVAAIAGVRPPGLN